MVPEHLGGHPGEGHYVREQVGGIHYPYFASLLASVFPPSRGAMGPLGQWPMAPMAPRGDAPLEFLNGEFGALGPWLPPSFGGEIQPRE